jgi:hypothetical protein
MEPESKQNIRYKQINFIGLQNNRHPSQHTVATFIKLLETVSKGLFRNRSQNRCHAFLDCRYVLLQQQLRSIPKEAFADSFQEFMIVANSVL